jgi:dTMP kinase
MSKFIVIEGLEGAGKSTALNQVKQILTAQSIDFIATREPGGTPLAEKMRDIVKSETDEKLTEQSELLLMYAARSQLVENVIKPALQKGQWVLGDRHDMSSLAYQGGGRQISSSLIMPIRDAVLNGFEPDLVLLMDIDPKIGLARAANRGELDRIEKEEIAFFERTREVFLTLAKERNNVIVIDAAQTLENVQQQIANAISNWMTENV